MRNFIDLLKTHPNPNEKTITRFLVLLPAAARGGIFAVSTNTVDSLGAADSGESTDSPDTAESAESTDAAEGADSTGRADPNPAADSAAGGESF